MPGRAQPPAEPSAPSRPQATFGPAAHAYLDSDSHRHGPDLDWLVAWSLRAPPGLTLDVATGGGHTARALAGTGRAVLATDVTPEMIEAARSEPHPRVRWAVADAAAQPVGDGSVAVAAVRIAPHHFSDLASFLSEARRALGVTGLLLIVDNVADPRADEWLNRMERLRDPSHVRSYTVDEWGRAVRSARFEILEVHTMFRRNDFSTWLHRPRPGPEAAHAVVGAFLDAPPEAAALYDIRIESGQVVSWRDQKILVAARPS